MKNKCMKILSIIVLSVIIINCIGNSVQASLFGDLQDWWNKQNDKANQISGGVAGQIPTGTPTTDSGTTNSGESNSGSSSNSGTNSGSSSSSSNSSNKGTDPGAKVGNATAQKKEQDLIEKAATASIGDAAGTLVDGVVGILTTLLRVEVLLVGFAGQSLATVTANSAGTLENEIINMVTPDQILFNRLAITDINFFQTDSFGTGSNKKTLDANSPVKSIREGVATWYYVLRTMAIIILLCILVYIGIKMAISTVAEEKAVYKQWFVNWLVSMALVFVLHYIILIVININNSFVDLLYGVRNQTLGQSDWGNYVAGLMFKGLNPFSALGSWTAVFVYLGIVILTFVFLIMYIKRMITIAFLIIVSPIITITYSIDKLNDNKSQALNTWFREFAEAVLIQPFHCIIYLVFISSAMSCIKTSGTLAAGILVVFCMFFIFKAEGLIKKIFGIKSESAGNGMQSAIAVLGTVGAAKDLMGRTKGLVGKSAGSAAKATGTGANTAPVNVSTNAVKTSNMAEQNMKNADNVNIGSVQNMNANIQSVGVANSGVTNVYDSERLATIHAGGMSTQTDYDYLMGQQSGASENGKNSNENYTIGSGNGLSNESMPNKNENASNLTPGIHTSDIPDVGENAATNPKKRTIPQKALHLAKMAGGAVWKANKAVAGAGMASGVTAAAMASVAGKDVGEMIAAGYTGYQAGKAAKETFENLKEQGGDALANYMKIRKNNNSESSNASSSTTSNNQQSSTSNVDRRKNNNNTKTASKPVASQAKPIFHPDTEGKSRDTRNNVVQTHDVGDNGELKQKMEDVYSSLMNNNNGE